MRLCEPRAAGLGSRSNVRVTPLDNDGFTLSPLATAAGSLGPLVASELLSSYLYPSTYRPKMFDSDADVKAKPSLYYGRDIAAPPPNFRNGAFQLWC